MEQLLPSLGEWSVRLFPVAVDHLWHSSLLAAAVLLLLVPLRRAPAGWRYSLVLLAAAKFLVPTVFFVDALRLLQPALGDRLPTLSILALDWASWMRTLGLGAVESGLAGGYVSLFVAIGTIWLCGALAVGVRWWVRYRSFSLRVRTARRLLGGREAALLGRARARIGLRRPVAVAALEDAADMPAGPGVWGVFRPVLVLPVEMSRQLSDSELEAIFVHELVHVARWDNLVAHLQMLLCCALWFHPLVWSLDRRLLAAREEACDERAVALLGNPETYARSLLKVVRMTLEVRLPALASIGAADLRSRLERILSGGSASRATHSLRVYALAVGAVLIAGSLVLRAAPVPVPTRCAKALAPVRANDRCPDKRLAKMAAASTVPESQPSASKTGRCRKGQPGSAQALQKLAGAQVRPSATALPRDDRGELGALDAAGQPAFSALP